MRVCIFKRERSEDHAPEAERSTLRGGVIRCTLPDLPFMLRTVKAGLTTGIPFIGLVAVGRDTTLVF